MKKTTGLGTAVLVKDTKYPVVEMRFISQPGLPSEYRVGLLDFLEMQHPTKDSWPRKLYKRGWWDVLWNRRYQADIKRCQEDAVCLDRFTNLPEPEDILCT